jgi:ferredoxin-NADP reductase/DMSO/TMAO reductase YedYZ heme-binding membrane subunit
LHFLNDVKRFWNILSARWFFWPLLAVPGIWRMVVPAMTDRLGFNPLFELLHRTGQIAVWMLVAVLALTPLKTMFPRWRVVAALNRHRRAVGVATFIYAALHVTEHFIYEGQVEGFFGNLQNPFYLTGTFGIVVLTILGLTSNDLSVRVFGYKFWKWLHRVVYAAAFAIAWHVAIMGKGNWPFAKRVFIPLLVFESLRLIWIAAQRIRRLGEWKDWREFVVERCEDESETIRSFYLRPANGHKLPPFKPGQFLTIQLDLPGEAQPVIRTYTLSDAPNPRTYRLSIKREPPPAGTPGVRPGVASNFFHDQIRPGSRLGAKPPGGHFHLDATTERPVVLVSAGVGVTPMIAMLNALVSAGSSQSIWFLHVARNQREHAFGKWVRDLAARHSNVRVHIAYSQPGPGDLAEKICDSAGRLEMSLIRQLLPGPGGDFYLCGPGPFMKTLYDGLKNWGVPAERIHYEFFGPATVKFGDKETATPANGASVAWQVQFQPKDVSIAWDGTQPNLLEFALGSGLKPKYGCKTGVCGSCACRLVSGTVRYDQAAAVSVGEGEVLLCCAQPESNVTIALE